MVDNLREKYRESSFIKQHYPSNIKKILQGVFGYTDVKFGSIKRSDGDVVIINCIPNDFISVEDYLRNFLSVDRVEQNGIYTNVFFKKEFFMRTIYYITNYGKK